MENMLSPSKTAYIDFELYIWKLRLEQLQASHDKNATVLVGYVSCNNNICRNDLGTSWGGEMRQHYICFDLFSENRAVCYYSCCKINNMAHLSINEYMNVYLISVVNTDEAFVQNTVV